MSDRDVDISSVIRRVTVHRSEALVRRVAAVGGRSLPLSLKVGPLPLTIQPASVRAAVTGEGGSLLEAAATVRVSVEPVGWRGVDRPDLEQALDDAQRVVDAAGSEVDRLRSELADVGERLRPVARNRAATGDRELVLGDREPVPPERRLALLRFADEQVSLLAEQLQAAERAYRSATRAFAEIADRWEAARREAGRRHELSVYAMVTVQGEGELAAGASLELSYLAAGATWRPSHRLHLDGDRSTLVIGGVVSQQTGEDWPDVHLELSTTDPRLNWDLPELKPVRIGRASPVTRGWRAPEPIPAELFADFDRAAKAEDEQLELAEPSRGAPLDPSFHTDAGPITAEAPAVRAAYSGLAMHDAAAITPDYAFDDPSPMQSMPPMPPMPAVAAAPGGPQARPASGSPRGRSTSRRGGRVGTGPVATMAASEASMAHAIGTGALEPADPERPDPAMADLDQLLLSAPGSPDRGRPRPTAGVGHVDALMQARHEALEAIRRAHPVKALGAHGSGVACVYASSRRVDVPSTRSTASVVLLEHSIDARDEYVTVPYQSTDVFRTVVFDNPFALPVVAGPVDLSGPKGYIGPADLDTLPVGARAHVGVGVEEGIGIERQVEHREDARGVRRNNRSLLHDVTVRVTNRLPGAATVVVRERVPTVPQTDDRMSVDELSVTPPWQPYQRHDRMLRGGRQWVVDVGASSVVELNAQWEIVIPAKHELDGGNRR